MSRELYRARNKKIQKLGRDGLVEQDRATGQEERVSQKAADISFGPERIQEQAARQTLSPRSPAKSRWHKKPVPYPKPTLEDGYSSAAMPPIEKQANSRTQLLPGPAASDLQRADIPHSGEAPALKQEQAADAPLSSHQNGQYETAERRVEQFRRKLEKAQAKLPIQRRAHLEREYNVNSGKVHRLRFELEVQPEQAAPSLPAQAGQAVKMAAVMKFHGKLREAEHQNVGVEAAHKGEFAAEQGVGRFLRWNKRRLHSKPYRAVRQAEQRLTMEKSQLVWQTALRDNPALRRSNILSKWVQKQKMKRQYIQAAQESQKTIQYTRRTSATAGKIIRAVQQSAVTHKSALLIVTLLALVIAGFSAGLSSCAAMLSGVQSSCLSTTYLADEQEICGADLLFTELETDLQLDISDTEVNYPGYDEYRYSIGEIGHDPYSLMSYLSAVYGAFTFEQVRPEIERLFGGMYQLTRTPITESRYDDDGQPYEWTVLQTTLTVGRLEDMIAAALYPGEQTDRYNAYQQALGNRQAYGNPLGFPWLGQVSSAYGWRVHPISGEKNLHRGVDIAAAQGTAISAIQDGWVVSAGNAGGYGLCVVIEDDKGYQSRYAHCSSLFVSVGQEVKRGDSIAAVGSTGNSTGAHLHLEVMLNGEYLNPLYFVDTGSGVTGPL